MTGEDEGKYMTTALRFLLRVVRQTRKKLSHFQAGDADLKGVSH